MPRNFEGEKQLNEEHVFEAIGSPAGNAALNGSQGKMQGKVSPNPLEKYDSPEIIIHTRVTEKARTKEPETVREVIEWSKANPIRWFVEGLVIEQGIHVLHGLEESFKTMLMLQLHEVLTDGGQFLLRHVEGGLRTGIAELEMKMQLSGSRFLNFWPNGPVPHIYFLPESARREVLTARTASDRIRVIADWAKDNGLDFVGIDSLAKLFPPGNDVSRQDLASDVFSNIQLLPTTLILAHDRKPPHESKGIASMGNAEIVGSGRMSQEPDVIHQVIRPHKRAPLVNFECGKMREGVKPEALELYFDRVDFRLHPVHPFLHLLPATEGLLIEQAERRYGWKERRSRDYIRLLKDLPGVESEQERANRPKRFYITLSPAEFRAALDQRAAALDQVDEPEEGSAAGS
jgi:hypothetical protein